MGVNREKAIADVAEAVKWNSMTFRLLAIDKSERVLDLEAALTELKDATLSLLAWKPVRDMDEVIARVERALEAK